MVLFAFLLPSLSLVASQTRRNLLNSVDTQTIANFIGPYLTYSEAANLCTLGPEFEKEFSVRRVNDALKNACGAVSISGDSIRVNLDETYKFKQPSDSSNWNGDNQLKQCALEISRFFCLFENISVEGVPEKVEAFVSHLSIPPKSSGLLDILIRDTYQLNTHSAEAVTNYVSRLIETSSISKIRHPYKVVNSSVMNWNGKTAFPVYLIAEIGSIELMKRLVQELGIDVNFQAYSNVDFTPLMVAATRGKIEMVELLLELGADVNLSKANGYTALLSAISYGTNADRIVELLLAAGAEVNAHDNRGSSPLHNACLLNNLAIAEKLINAGADINHGNSRGETPVHVATYQNSAPILSFLLSKSANVDGIPTSGKRAQYTPLMIAALQGHIECAKILIRYRANEELLDKNGRSAFDLAESKPMVALLHRPTKYRNDRVNGKRSIWYAYTGFSMNSL